MLHAWHVFLNVHTKRHLEKSPVFRKSKYINIVINIYSNFSQLQLFNSILATPDSEFEAASQDARASWNRELGQPEKAYPNKGVAKLGWLLGQNGYNHFFFDLMVKLHEVIISQL